LIVYSAMPYLLAGAPLVIVLLSILLGGCTMTRLDGDAVDRTRFYSEADSRAGEEPVRALDRRAARAELQRANEEAQRCPHEIGADAGSVGDDIRSPQGLRRGSPRAALADAGGSRLAPLPRRVESGTNMAVARAREG
jgi:hypothetical protein